MQRVLVIVGASRGIGQAIALALAKPDTHLVLAARDAAQLEAVAATARNRGSQVSVVPCDLAVESAVHHLITMAATIRGQIDVLINSAGCAIVKPFEQMTLSEWEETIQIGLTGTFLSCKYAVHHMTAGGLIVNIASIAARNVFPGWAAYCASKSGVVGFSNAIREELRPRHIRVTTVLPAATDTTLWDAIPGEWNRATMLQPEDVAQAIVQLVHQPAHVATEELVIGHVVGKL